MVWDFAEGKSTSRRRRVTSGWHVDWIAKVIDACQRQLRQGLHSKQMLHTQIISIDKVVSTDPPYYDNIGYADLSDFFYVWLRRSLKPVFPDLFATLAVPKAEELVATPYRHGSKEKAETFFLDGMTQAMHRLAEQAHPAFPVTIYYAFKQSESDGDEGTASTGWETFLDAVIRAGFAISGTWPMRTERLGNRMIGSDTNALASSIVLVCRKRADDAPTATRREFVTALKAELPVALAHLQRGNIAPVDLAQAAIGPGMAVYTRYAKVLDAAGKPLSVREALALINQTLDEALAEQEGDFDADTPLGAGLVRAVRLRRGRVRRGRDPLQGQEHQRRRHGRGRHPAIRATARCACSSPTSCPPIGTRRPTSASPPGRSVHHLIRVLEAGGESAAAELAAKLGSQAETARELAYRLYTLCERKKRAAEALSYNGLVQSWPEITRLAAREWQAATHARRRYLDRMNKTDGNVAWRTFDRRYCSALPQCTPSPVMIRCRTCTGLDTSSGK